MKCMVCGAELPEGSTFCTTCGNAITPAPIAGDDMHTVLLDENGKSVPEAVADAATGRQGAPMGDDTQTVLIDNVQNAQAASQSFAQSGLNPQQPQFTQPGMQPQMNQTGYGQPMQPQMNQTGYGQPMQPQMNQTGYGQPMQPQMNQTGYGQPMQPQMNQTGYGQPMQPQMNQMGYGQPQMGYGQQMPPKPPKKPLSPKAKTGIIVGSIAAVVLIVFFAVIFPILTRSKLGGSYASNTSSYTYYFDNGTYVVRDSDGDVEEAGLYTYDKKTKKISMTDLDGYTETGTYDPKKNTVSSGWGTVYKSKNKKEKLGYSLTATCVNDWKAKVETAANELGKDPSLCENAYYYGVDIDEDFKDDTSEFAKQLKVKIGYDSDPALRAMVEGGYVEFDIYMSADYDDDYNVKSYEATVYDYVW